VFVIGSYFLAQEINVKRPRRRRAKRPEPVVDAPDADRELEVSGRR
jgi:hypothetical protein